MSFRRKLVRIHFLGIDDVFAAVVPNLELTTAFAVATVLRIVDFTPVVDAVDVALAVAVLEAGRREIEEATGRVFVVTEDRADDVSLLLRVRLTTLARLNGTTFVRPTNDADEFERESDVIGSFFGTADNDFLAILPDDNVLGVRRASEGKQKFIKIILFLKGIFYFHTNGHLWCPLDTGNATG